MADSQHPFDKSAAVVRLGAEVQHSLDDVGRHCAFGTVVGRLDCQHSAWHRIGPPVSPGDHDPLGIVNATRDTADSIENGADKIGELNREATNSLRDRAAEGVLSADNGAEEFVFYMAGFSVEMWRAATPQDGQEVMAAVSTAPLAAVARGANLADELIDAADEASDALSLLRRASRVCSFTAGTVVWMCDGTLRPIEDVAEGDRVLARDEKTGAVECRRVVNPYANPDRAIVELELVDEQGRVEVIETTDNHPFFVEGQGFTRVDELRLGERIPSGAGGTLTVERIYLTGRVETVYNFGVDDFRTYFVEESGAWVHNCFEKTRDYLKNTDRGEVNVETVIENLLLKDKMKLKGGSPDGRFIHFKDGSGRVRARIDPAESGKQAKTPYRHLHLYNSAGESLDINGNVVDKASKAAHIPLE